MRKRQALVIFAEGSTEMVMQLRPLKKGMGRMAIQSLEADGTLDIKVLPVGMTFIRGFSPLSEVVIDVGEAFSIKELLDQHVGEDQISVISSKAHSEMSNLLLNLDDRNNEDMVRMWMDIYNYKSDPNFFPRVVKNSDLPSLLKNVESKLNGKDKEWIDRNKTKHAALKSKLALAMVAGRKNYLGFFLMLIPGLVGLIYFFIPIKCALMLQRKMVKQKEFISAIIIAAGGAFTLSWFLISFILLVMIFPWYFTLLFMGAAFLCGISALYLLDFKMRI
jgi:hypothetical protein